MEKIQRHTKRALIGVVGGFVVLVGLIMVPYPGPGWLIVFGGLAILATEFAFAGRVLEKARGYYDTWVAWLKRQPVLVRILVLALTGAVIILTLWLFNAFGIASSVIGWNEPWLVSPLVR